MFANPSSPNPFPKPFQCQQYSSDFILRNSSHTIRHPSPSPSYHQVRVGSPARPFRTKTNFYIPSNAGRSCLFASGIVELSEVSSPRVVILAFSGGISCVDSVGHVCHVGNAARGLRTERNFYIPFDAGWTWLFGSGMVGNGRGEVSSLRGGGGWRVCCGETSLG